MEEKQKKDLASALVRAIEAERTGQHFYRMAAKGTRDPKGREVFETLAEEESGHEAFLAAQVRALLEGGALDDGARLGERRDLSGESPIFSEKIKSRAQSAHAEMSALAVGVQLELGALQYYREQAAAASSPEARSFFGELSEWESGHYHALLRQQEALKEDYWARDGFAPF
ncbi:MAG: ferritin family protein [Planctomycetes bacterium]|nr:ferritin family protein [Planctomycetota bacterium]